MQRNQIKHSYSELLHDDCHTIEGRYMLPYYLPYPLYIIYPLHFLTREKIEGRRAVVWEIKIWRL